MRPLRFEPFLRLGISQIDQQHEELVEMINETQNIVLNHRDPADLIPILNRMNDFAIRHFTTEEELMREFSYPGLADHKQQHDISLTRAFGFDGTLLVSDPDAGTALLELLRDWLLEHIEADTEMVEFLKQQGLS